MNSKELYLRKAKAGLTVFTILLVLSGLTAFPIETQLALVDTGSPLLPEFAREWLTKVIIGVKQTNFHYPFMAYGTDWLAFGHIVIALFFIGAIKDPIRYIWNIKAGMVASLGVFPLAFIAGHIRGIPFWWQLVDCSFGLFGFLLLLWCYRQVNGVYLTT